MHDCKLTHTDLKPENVLLKKIYDFNEINIKDIDDLTIKIIDLGSATYDHDYHTTIINTRQYRAPEVLLGCGWDNRSDLWGIACIVLELYTGDVYFCTHESREHVAMVEKSGGAFPYKMVKARQQYRK